MAAREVSPGRWFVIAHLGEPNGGIRTATALTAPTTTASTFTTSDTSPRSNGQHGRSILYISGLTVHPTLTLAYLSLYGMTKVAARSGQASQKAPSADS
jgi:sarcosine oxidase gamma subunit